MSNSNQQVPTLPYGCFLDYTYCASPNCNNECGRKMSKEIETAMDKLKYDRVAFGYFCGE
jgi:hypothetical protein